jgi:fermentation-respiration switch protein FrsA (DUF1100 family)
MKTMLIGTAAVLAMLTAQAKAEDAEGYWSGSIANSLRVVVQFHKPADGRWEATLSVPAQNLVTKVEDLVVTPDQVGFALPRLRASYKAAWDPQTQSWNGTWTQGRSAPLNLMRSSPDAAKLRRPQEEEIAVRAPSYGSSEVSFENDAAKVTLAGTLTVPQGKGPFPAVVLVQGSGFINRDGDVSGHKTLLVLADHLSRQGIAVLRYDKRGVGKSTGKLREATMPDLAADAEAAVRFLRSRPEVAPRHIGVVGHSEGGLIAPLIAARDPKLGFIVMLAAPGLRGERLLVEQLALTSKARGVPERLVERDRLLHQALFAAMVAEPTLEGANAKASLILQDAERKGELPAGAGKTLIERFGTSWFHGLLSYEPGPVLKTVRQPVLALNGERDLQVPAAMDLPAIRLALQDNPRTTVKEMPGLNHLFQTAKTGAIGEYGEIEETFAPAALETISAWIKAALD